MAESCDEGHLLCHGTVGNLRLCCPCRPVCLLPGLQSPARFVDVAANRPLIRIDFLRDDVVVVRLELLSSVDVDAAFVLRHKLVPPAMPHLIGRIGIIGWEIRLLCDQLWIYGEVRAYEIAVLGTV